jgi:hypothetical protein
MKVYIFWKNFLFPFRNYDIYLLQIKLLFFHMAGKKVPFFRKKPFFGKYYIILLFLGAFQLYWYFHVGKWICHNFYIWIKCEGIFIVALLWVAFKICNLQKTKLWKLFAAVPKQIAKRKNFLHHYTLNLLLNQNIYICMCLYSQINVLRQKIRYKYRVHKKSLPLQEFIVRHI